MKVAAFRLTIDAVTYALNSFKSAATDAERLREADWVRRAVREALGAEAVCGRATPADRQRLAAWVEGARHSLTVAGLEAGFQPTTLPRAAPAAPGQPERTVNSKAYKSAKCEDVKEGQRLVNQQGDVYEVKRVKIDGRKVLLTVAPLVQGIIRIEEATLTMRAGSSVTLAEFAD